MRLEDILGRPDIPEDVLEAIRNHLQQDAGSGHGDPPTVTPLEREQLAAFACLSDVVVYYRDPSLQVAWTNLAAASPLGEAVEGHCYRLWQGRQTPCPECPVLAAFAGGEVQEAERTAPDGRVYWLRAHPVHDAQGKLVGVVELGTDITERKRLQQSLAQSESLYRRAIESAAGVPYRRDHRTGGYDFVGAGIRELLDIAPEEFSVVSFRAMIRERVNTHPEAPAEWLDYDRAYARGKVTRFRADYRVVTPAGREKWISDAATAVRDEQTGDLLASLGFLQDVTERKRAEQRILRLTGLYAVLSEANQAIVRLHDRDALLRTICRVVVEHGGFSAAWIAEQVPAGGALSLQAVHGLSPREAELLTESLAGARGAAGPCAQSLQTSKPCVLRASDPGFVTPGGESAQTATCSAVAALPLQIGEQSAGALGVSTSDAGLLDDEGMALLAELADDISFALLSIEREEAHERSKAALRESEERYRTITDTSPLSILLTRDSRYLYANPAAVELLGYPSAADIEGQPLGYLLDPEQVEMVTTRHRLAIAGHPNEPVELSVRRADGTTIGLETVSVPIRLQDGPAVLVMAVDLSARKQAEEAARLAAVGQLAAGVAHEFNNILATLMLRADYAQSSGQFADYEKLAETVSRQSERGAQICSKLATFSRPQAPRRRPVCVETAIEAAHGLLARQLQLADIRTELLLRARPACIMADAGQLEQVFVNLFINASHAMPGGGVLSVTTRTETTDGDGTEVVVRVTDTGTGMPPEVAARVFEPFFTTKGELGGSDVPGSGLGLAVSHGIVSAHGGTIAVASQVGRGSTFELRFAAHTAQPAATPTAPGRRDAAGGSEAGAGARVLLVEDEPDLREVIGLVLSRGGYRVQPAAGAAEAIELLRQSRFDIIVTDLLMPGGGGRAVLAHAHHLPDPPPAIVLTGRADPGCGESAHDLGAAECLHKPVTGQEVLQAVRRALG